MVNIILFYFIWRLRTDCYSGIMDVLNAWDHVLYRIGQRVILSMSFVGGLRHINELYHDAMTIVHVYGKLD